jgi:hypothetical protein
MGLDLATGLGAITALSGVGDTVSSHFQAKDFAEDLRDRGQREAARIRSAGQQVLGAQRAGFAASGVTQAGTPRDVADSTSSQIEQELLRRAMPFFDRAIDIKAMAAANLIGGITGSLVKGAGAFLAAGGELPKGTAPAPKSAASLTGTPGQSSLLSTGQTPTGGGRFTLSA